MAVVDIIILIFMIYGGIRGYNKGFIDQMGGLLGITLAIIASLKFSDVTKNYLLEKEWISEQFIGIFSLVITFILVYLGVIWIARSVEKIVKSIGVNFVNRFAGAAIGLFINALILLVILYFVFPFIQDVDFIQKSEYLQPLYEATVNLKNSLF